MTMHVGSVFRTRHAFAGLRAGVLGLCYDSSVPSRAESEQYASVLFEDGIPISLSGEELRAHCDWLGVMTDFSPYRFEGLAQLMGDFDAGHFAKALKPAPRGALGPKAA
jgi:hypothetical protein